MTSEEIKASNPIVDFIQDRAHTVRKTGNTLATNGCPINEHKPNHYCVSVDPERNVWYCNDCKEGGSVVDWVRLEKNCSLKDAFDFFDEIAGQRGLYENGVTHQLGESILTKTYDYTDENGRLLYQCCRYEPKKFNQRRPSPDGEWIWDMEGVTRVLYNLPRVLLAPMVCVTEGERDADTLNKYGLTATTNVGGSEKWLDAYSVTLAGKDVLVFPDRDKAGREHEAKVTGSIREKSNSVKIVQMPKGYKDITEYLESLPEDDRLKSLNKLIDTTPHLIEPLPIYSLREQEDMYRDYINNLENRSYSLSKFSSKFAHISDGLMPGEVVILVGDTSTGKTAVMQSIARSASPLPVLFFELELPLPLMFQRTVQMGMKCLGKDVQNDYTNGKAGGKESYMERYVGMDNVMLCPQAGISMDTVERYITRSSLKFGQPPAMVMLDYMALVRDHRLKSRYEQIANTAEQCKVVAKNTNTIMFVGSQVTRPENKKSMQDVNIHSAKGAGEIESSGNLVIGLSRPKAELLKMKILKNTNGPIGDIIDFDFNGATMQISEQVLKRPF